MKALNLSKLAFVCALVLGVMVFWAVAAPSVMGTDSVRGGWVWIGEGACCWGNGNDNCLNNPWPADCWFSEIVNICNLSPDGGPQGACMFEPFTPCVGNEACNRAIDTDCQ